VITPTKTGQAVVTAGASSKRMGMGMMGGVVGAVVVAGYL
jgi:hypothetical protein